MSEIMILHHYDNSPYAEKIRLMFGLTGLAWQSAISPAWPPRPNIDPLSGGYRRIPIAQVGADIFCDSALIAEEIARLSGCEAVNPKSITGEAKALMVKAEKDVFFAAVRAISPLRLVGTLLGSFGPVGAYRFVKDRGSLMQGGSARPPSAENARRVLQSLLDELEQHLDSNDWVDGEQPSVADFSIYHPLWLHVACSRKPLKAGPNVTAWYQRVEALGHGQREDITQAQIFAAAREAQPRALPADAIANAPQLGEQVEVAPSDYGTVPVAGELVAVTKSRLILARDTSEFGRVHVHFPREGYAILAS